MAVTMEEAISAIRDKLDAEELHYDFREEANVFFVNMGLKRTKLRSATLAITLIPARNSDYCMCILSYAMVGVKADADCLAEMCEFLHRANYGLNFGNFEIDVRDGEMRFKLSVNCVDALPSADEMEDLLYLPLSMIERYGDGILAVSTGIISAEEAIRKIEDK